MIQINLLPDIKIQYQKTRRTQAKVISGAILACIIAIGAVVLVALWVYGVQNIQKAQLKKTIDTRYNELRSIKDIDKYVTVQNQLTKISGLHANKMILSRFLDVVAKLNPKAPNNVRLSMLSVDTTTTTFTMDGETDTYTGLETFRDTLRNAKLSYAVTDTEGKAGEPIVGSLFTPESVTIISQGLGKKADGSAVVSFKISVQYDPKVFARDSTNIVVSVPTKDTTQSKQDTPDVFSPSQATQEGGQ